MKLAPEIENALDRFALEQDITQGGGQYPIDDAGPVRGEAAELPPESIAKIRRIQASVRNDSIIQPIPLC